MAIIIFKVPDIAGTIHSLESSHILVILNRTKVVEDFAIRLCLLCSSIQHWCIGSCVELRC